MDEKKKQNECKCCGKLTKNKSFCSLSCASKINSKGNKHYLINKKNKTGIFTESKKLKMLNSKKSVATRKRKELGIFSKDPKVIMANWKKAALTNAVNKTGVYSKDIQSMGGRAAVEVLREKFGYKYKGIAFASKIEREIGANIYNQFGKLALGKSFQVRVGNFLYDFYIKSFDCFIEVHPFNSLYETKQSHHDYNFKRLQNLKANNLIPNLVVIK